MKYQVPFCSLFRRRCMANKHLVPYPERAAGKVLLRFCSAECMCPLQCIHGFTREKKPHTRKPRYSSNPVWLHCRTSEGFSVPQLHKQSPEVTTQEYIKQKPEQEFPGLKRLGWEFHALSKALHGDEDELLTKQRQIHVVYLSFPVFTRNSLLINFWVTA